MSAVGSAQSLIDFNGRPAVQLQAPDGAQAVVLLQGAQIVSWLGRNGQERLYLSERAVYAQGQAVRGGVPVIFPQFDQRGPLGRHGFARLRPWQLQRAEGGRDDALAVLRLQADETTLVLWPEHFAAELTFSVSDERLDIELEVQNTGGAELSFTAALHSYLRLSEVEEASLEGLRGETYLDSTTGRESVQGSAALAIDGEIDRIYWGGSQEERTLVLREPGRAYAIEQHGFPDVVVWNPWADKAATLTDMPPLDFRRFLCVEAAVIGTPVRLAPGQEWWGRQTLRVLR